MVRLTEWQVKRASIHMTQMPLLARWSPSRVRHDKLRPSFPLLAHAARDQASDNSAHLSVLLIKGLVWKCCADLRFVMQR